MKLSVIEHTVAAALTAPCGEYDAERERTALDDVLRLAERTHMDVTAAATLATLLSAMRARRARHVHGATGELAQARRRSSPCSMASWAEYQARMLRQRHLLESMSSRELAVKAAIQRQPDIARHLARGLSSAHSPQRAIGPEASKAAAKEFAEEELRRRMHKLRRHAVIVGKAASLLQTIYTEVTFRPGHQGQKRSREEFEAAAAAQCA